MENLTSRTLLTKIDWKWILVSYCFLVLFHLVPTQYFFIPPWYIRFGVFWDFFAWIGVGIAVVSTFVAYRSRKLTLLEPGIAGSLYMLTILLCIKAPGLTPYYYAPVYYTPIYYTYTGFRIALLIFSFVVGFGAAGFTVLWRQRREMQRAKI
jgi:hypothetical protein